MNNKNREECFFTKETFRSYSLENPWWHTQPGKFLLNCGAGNY